ncbi:MAG: hypothetical protein K2M36_02830, partial [Clostridia bacterium]|nr:hypothetical protein [Clostridia bacterium]
MNGTCARYKNIALKLSVAVTVCLICAFALCACNSSDETKSEKSLYFADIEYSPDDGIMYAVVALSGDENKKLQSSLLWQSQKYALDSWYNRQDVIMTVRPSELYAELGGIISEEQRAHEGAEYNLLKVVLRYDTIYKSLKSDGSVEKNGNKYLHKFILDEENGEQECAVWLKSQNAASWYALLIGCGII